MAEEEPEEGQPSLELPSIGGWRRKRRARATEAPAEPPAPVAEAAPTPTSGGSGPVPARPTEPTSPPPAPAPPAPAPAEMPTATAEQATTVLAQTDVETPPPGARRLRIRPRRPGGYPAVLGAGLLIGLALVALMWASLRTCEQVQGTSSCGTAGYPMLVVVLVASVVLGGLLLRLLRAPDPVSTSFLGVGLATVLALLFLVDHLDQTRAVVIVPLLTAGCFAAAHWVTTTFIEPGDRPR